MPIPLSPEQRRIVESTAPAIVVSAGAGAGKTEVIANRVEDLISTSEGETYRILALSYTVKAALELEERLRARVHDFRRVDAETIHSFAHRLIRQHGTWENLPAEPEVLDRDEDRVELLTTWLRDLGEYVESRQARQLLADIDLGRATLTDAPYLTEYRDALAVRQALDFPEMLEVAARLLQRDWLREQIAEVYRHLIVDEAQNLTAAQYRLLTMILGDRPSAVDSMFVGDEKQSIVQFAGADPRLMTRYEVEFGAERVDLTQNFRSAAAIVELTDRVAAQLNAAASSAIVSAAEGQVDVHHYSDEHSEGRATAEWALDLLENGLPLEALFDGEDPYVRPEEIGVLCRSSAGLRWTAEALDELGVEYSTASDPRDWMGSRLGRCLVDLVSYRAGPLHPSSQAHLETSASASVECLRESPVAGFAVLVDALGDAEDPATLFELLGSGVGDDPAHEAAWASDRTLLQHTWQQFIDRTPAADRTFGNLRLHISRVQRGEPGAQGVQLLTVHKSQGREFRAVSVLGLNDGQFPDFRQTSPEERKAELHCFYVSVSRASRLLRLSRSLNRQTRYGPRQTEPSEYLRFAA